MENQDLKMTKAVSSILWFCEALLSHCGQQVNPRRDRHRAVRPQQRARRRRSSQM